MTTASIYNLKYQRTATAALWLSPSRYAEQSMQLRTNILCLLFALALVGCGDSPQHDASPLPVTRPPKTATPVRPLIDGPRPQSVADATMTDVHELHMIGGVNDEFVCIEGTAIRTGEIMGAPYVRLACPTCGVATHCEGYALADLKFGTDTHVAIRGRIFNKKMLAESHPVTQQQFDAAIVAEASPAETLDASTESGIK